MNRRLRWALIITGAVLLVCVGGPFAATFPQRSAFLARQEPGACALVARTSPFGGVTGCIDLGRRTPPLYGAGHVFLMLETGTGPAVVRLDYTGTDDESYHTTAVEVPTWEAPGVSHDTVVRLQTGIDGRGGLKARPWAVYPAPN
ncbi:hypothetical protein [Dactylosporangium sp. CA-092794]|uniref:hypothetical protein n=1 Tax=Dactylosporangium sp. CA-092794 TaxID=3239929 RepID=UPI003D8E0F12